MAALSCHVTPAGDWEHGGSLVVFTFLGSPRMVLLRPEPPHHGGPGGKAGQLRKPPPRTISFRLSAVFTYDDMLG